MKAIKVYNLIQEKNYSLLLFGGHPVNDMAQMYRKIWSQGPAGSKIPLNLQRSGDLVEAHVQSISRGALLKRPQLH